MLCLLWLSASGTVAPSPPSLPPATTTYGSLISFKGAGQTMQVHAFLGTDRLIVVDSTDLPWKTVEVAFSGGTIESVEAEHGLSAVLKGNSTVGIGYLGTSPGASYPSGLVMTVTFSSDTNMDDVIIDFTSPATAIISDYPTVAFARLAPNGRVATIVQDTKNEIYAFAPGVPINTVEIQNDMTTLEITPLLSKLTVSNSSTFFGLGYLDGSATAMAQEVPIAAGSEALDPTMDGGITYVSIQSATSPPPQIEYLIIVVGALFVDLCETCGFPFVYGSLVTAESCIPNAAGDACVTASDGATCSVSQPTCSCDGVCDAACLKMAILGGPQHATMALSAATTGSQGALHAQEEPWSHAA